MATEIVKGLAADAMEVKVGDKTYKAAPLTLKDLAKIRTWTKKKLLRSFMEEASEMKMDYDLFAKTISRLMAPSEPGAGGEEMATEEGIRYTIFLSLQKNHPELKESDIDFPLSDVEALSAVITAISIPDVKEAEKEEAPLP